MLTILGLFSIKQNRQQQAQSWVYIFSIIWNVAVAGRQAGDFDVTRKNTVFTVHTLLGLPILSCNPPSLPCLEVTVASALRDAASSLALVISLNTLIGWLQTSASAVSLLAVLTVRYCFDRCD